MNPFTMSLLWIYDNFQFCVGLQRKLELRHSEMIKHLLNGKWFKINDKMTYLDKYNSNIAFNGSLGLKKLN